MKQKLFLSPSAACSAARSASSGVAPSGQGTYLISSSEMCCDRNGFGVKAAAFKEASEFCTESGKTLRAIAAKQKRMVLLRSSARAEVEFTCD